MNFLPIILIVVFLLNKRGGNAFENFDIESISPLLSLFGVSEDVIKMLSSDEIKNLTKGNFDLKTIIPLLTTLFSNFNKVDQTPIKETFTNETSPEYLNPIKDVANADIISTLGNYFN